MQRDKTLEILDCTIRDGGYVNNWQFNRKMVREVYRALSKSGVDYVELGFRGTENHFDPDLYGAWRFSTEEDIRFVSAGINGAKIAVMGDYGKIEENNFVDQKDSAIDLVRIAANRDKVIEAIKLLEKLKTKGYKISLQAMGFTSYSHQEIRELKSAVVSSQLDYLYIADSYGSILPHEIASIFEPFLDLSSLKIGFHPHNSLQMAFANTLEAIKIGIDIVDSSIFGMGRGSGNLPTEILVAYMQKSGMKKYNVIPLLNCIERYFSDIHKETPWGYQLPYLISGMFKCHPYYAAELVRRREYSMEDIWKALEIVEDLNPVGFDVRIIEDLIKRGFVGNNATKKKTDDGRRKINRSAVEHKNVSYKDRHKGRDFLILANGPSIRTYREQINEFIKIYDPVVLGANFLGGLFVPHYHAFNREKRFVLYVDTVDEKSNLLIGENLPDALVREYTSRNYETLFFNDTLDSDFSIINGRITCNCRTVSVLLIGVAIVMGGRRFFVAGMDGYLDKKTGKLFYNEKFDPEEYELNVQRHQWNEYFLKQIDKYIQDRGNEGLHIITPTSHQSFYKGIDNYL